MIRQILTIFAMLLAVSACGAKDKTRTDEGAGEARGPDGHLEDGFYLKDTSCENFGVHVLYVAGDTFSVGVLNLKGEACSNPSISDSDVRVFSLGPAQSWDEFRATFDAIGTTLHTDGLRTMTATNASGFETTFKKYFTNRDRSKEVSMTVSDFLVTKTSNVDRVITAKVVVHGPDMDWEPWVWCESPSEPGKMLRVENERGSYKGPSPSFTLEAKLDSYRYKFPTTCQINVGFLAPSANNGFTYFLDVIRGEDRPVE